VPRLASRERPSPEGRSSGPGLATRTETQAARMTDFPIARIRTALVAPPPSKARKVLDVAPKLPPAPNLASFKPKSVQPNILRM
jgi:hypothetical protein